MRKLRYQVAASLDGYIADAKDGYDWIVSDPAIDFAALYEQFDTAVMGRGTFEVMLRQGSHGTVPGLEVVVFSRKLRAGDHPAVRIVGTDPVDAIAALKQQPGKDIWLFGGGKLFRTLLDAALVDTIEIAVIPVLLGDGIRVIAAGRLHAGLKLTETTKYPSGIVMVRYDVARAS
jgi:dihydrofolate reductase